MAGKDLPEDIKQKFLASHEENVTLKESYKTAQEKLNKAKQVGHSNMFRNTFVA
jgi:protein HOOK3